MPRAVAWPMLLRPPDLVRPTVSDLTGLLLYWFLRSIRIRPRRAGLVGLKFLSAIASDPRRNVDRLAFGQRHDRLLGIRALVGFALPARGLALGDHRVDAGHGDVEQRLHRRLDLRLGRVDRHHEDDRIMLG